MIADSYLFDVMPAWTFILAAFGFGAARLWYALPLITSVSLVYAATRHEQMGQILIHALRFAIWIVVFMAIVLAVIQLLGWLQ